jgi:hypothetical protein
MSIRLRLSLAVTWRCIDRRLRGERADIQPQMQEFEAIAAAF